LQSKNSYLVYDLSNMKVFKKVRSTDIYNIEAEARFIDDSFVYYLSSLGFFLKISKFDDFKIFKPEN